MRCAVGKSFRGGAVAEDGKKLASRKELIFTFFLLSRPSVSHELIKMLCVCLHVNQGGANHGRCTQRL